MVLDISTKFFVVRPVSSLGTDCTIQALTSVFNEQGLPLSIRCDRGRNFVSDLFQQYCQHLGISLSLSSAYHHSENPAERAIRTVKVDETLHHGKTVLEVSIDGIFSYTIGQQHSVTLS